LHKLNLIVPSDVNRIIEPFVGGGSFFINFQLKNSIISDTNRELITSYLVIKNNPQKLIKLLDEYQNNLHSKDFYLKLRTLNVDDLDDLHLAARFIYLNKAGFNGIYRVNSKGEFNVPYGKKDEVNLYNEENIMNFSKFLNEFDIEIYNKDYREIIKKAKKGDLVFLDPPYDKINKNSFVSYNKDSFERSEQINLANELKKLDKKGIKFILTNHSTDFIMNEYEAFDKIKVIVNRFVSPDSTKRVNAAEEVIIKNFKMDDMDERFKELINTMKETNRSIDYFVD